ncbi:hypothetical protein CKAN_02317700 [Cinnamomum micranthum f. kanehirae]|uniref:Uncharacterized protein n=1 Tax=Cinnamomum micranthum f. kanehirae TaxID=337451 RepID=A0A443PSY1_9MAGN|nr:hypothetical protein CKAN_02317700 [Cinnamomum micranthum f. kanehirae]
MPQRAHGLVGAWSKVELHDQGHSHGLHGLLSRCLFPSDVKVCAYQMLARSRRFLGSKGRNRIGWVLVPVGFHRLGSAIHLSRSSEDDHHGGGGSNLGSYDFYRSIDDASKSRHVKRTHEILLEHINKWFVCNLKRYGSLLEGCGNDWNKLTRSSIIRK